jgi:hypothetical protein
LDKEGGLKKMKKWIVTYTDEIEADTEEQAYQHILAYLEECVRYDDVTAFDFKEVKQNAV